MVTYKNFYSHVMVMVSKRQKPCRTFFAFLRLCWSEGYVSTSENYNYAHKKTVPHIFCVFTSLLVRRRCFTFSVFRGQCKKTVPHIFCVLASLLVRRRCFTFLKFWLSKGLEQKSKLKHQIVIIQTGT